MFAEIVNHVLFRTIAATKAVNKNGRRLVGSGNPFGRRGHPAIQPQPRAAADNKKDTND